jgi:predicted metal-dependent hydrolase
MPVHIQLGDVTVNVVMKDIKNVHLSVHPPTGRVTISAPLHMSLDTVRVFAISKLGWIRRQQGKFREQERETPREYLDRESHYVWGRRYLLKVTECERPPSVELKHKHMHLSVRPGTDDSKREAIMEDWYRVQVRQAVPSLVEKWEKLIGVKVERIFIQHMKTKWGSCNPAAKNIRLNTDLAKKPHECLEYLVVHELVHMLEPTHNARFIGLMDKFMPKWRFYREQMNRLPVRHEDWRY